MPRTHHRSTERAHSKLDVDDVDIPDVHTQGWLLPEEFPHACLKLLDRWRGDVTFFRDDIAIQLAIDGGTASATGASRASRVEAGALA